MLQYFSQGKGSEGAKYGPEDFLFRWKKVERIIEKEGIDGLLLITGLDGAEHPSTSYLFNWLFLGLSGGAVFANKYLDPVFAEMIVVVGVKESFIFVTPDAKKQLQHLLYSLQNCTVFCPTAVEYAAKDKLDILKISAFYRAVSPLSKIGFFLDAQQDSKIVQKWSIIQAYALEPVGRTFFTLRFQTTNIHSKLTPLFKNFDKYALRGLLEVSAYALAGQIHGSIQCIEYTKSSERQAITELQLQEPLFEAADIQRQGGEERPVRVIFGKRTGNTGKSSKKTSIADQKAFHLIVEHVDPTSKLQIWRTYFLDLNIAEYSRVQMVQQQSSQSFLAVSRYITSKDANPDFENQKLIAKSYLSLVQAVLDAISTISRDYRNLTREFLLGHISSKLVALLGNTYGAQLFGKDRIEIWLESYDSQGENKAIDFKDSITFKLTSTFYILKARLNGLNLNGELLGSVAFSEGFLLQEGCYLLLTKASPYFDFWQTRPDANSLLENPNPNVEFAELGPSLSTEAFRSRLFVAGQKQSGVHLNVPIIPVRLFFHQKGIRLHGEKIGWHIIPYTSMENPTVVNKIPGQWMLFKREKPLIFAGIESGELALQFRGKSFDFLLKRSNDKNNPWNLQFVDEIPSVLGDDWYFALEILKKIAKDGASIHQHQILQTQFLWSFIEAKQLMVLNQMKDLKLAAFKSLYSQKQQKKFEDLTSTKQQIVVITGTYATAKHRLAQNLSVFGPAGRKYPVFHIPYAHVHSRIPPAAFLEMLEEWFEQEQPSNNDILLIVLPAWLNATETIGLLNEKYHIRSVVSKIKVSNFVSSSNEELTENVLTFAVPGYTQTIVVDSNGESEANISVINKILWAFNKQARLLRASNSKLSTGQCADIVKDNLFNTEYHKFLRNKYGALYRFDSLSRLNPSYISFKYPIVNLPGIRNLSSTEGYLLNPKLISQQLQPKRIEAENSKDELMETLYYLEQSLTVIRKREKVPHVRCLKGVFQLQDGQRLEVVWANAQYREVPVSKDTELGVFVLCRNYDQFSLKQFLLSLTKRDSILQQLKPLIHAQSLTEEDKTKISRDGRNQYLENGDFYDGYFYRDAEGHILPSHPSLPRLINEWLTEQNRVIEQHNKILRAEWEQYCSKYE